MLDLVLLLLDKCISLAKRREESDRKLYDDFVVPAIADFERVHQNYVETFQSYRRELGARTAPLTLEHPLLQRIEEDSLFSAQLRSRLDALQESRDDPVFGALMNAIAQYTRGTEASKQVLVAGRRLLNAPRNSTIQGLKELFQQDTPEPQKLKRGMALLDRVVEELQVGYARVMSENVKLKKQLLDRRVK